MKSLAELCKMPPADFAAWAHRVRDGRAATLLTDWNWWRRGDQCAPDGDWHVWMLLAGRGFGKTRTGAEWVRGYAEAHAGARIALVAASLRRVRLPVEASVRVAVDGIETMAFLVTGDGEVLLDAAPAAGAAVRAGYLFDVPVRFAEDRLETSRATFLAGEVTSVPLVEVRAPW